MGKENTGRYDNRLNGGRVIDTKTGTVYSPNQLRKMQSESDKGKKRK